MVIGRRPEKGWILVDAGWMALSRDRGTARHPVDQGYGMVCDIDGNAVAGLGGYNLNVATNAAATLTNGTTAVTAIRVAVTVTHGAESFSLTGWRTDHGS